MFSTVAKVSTSSNFGFNDLGMLVSNEGYRIGSIQLTGKEIELDEGTQINLFLVLDNSGSMGMTYKGIDKLTKNQQVLNTLTNLVTYLNDVEKVGKCDVHLEIQSFSDSFAIQLPLTKMTGLTPEDFADLLTRLEDVKTKMVPVGSTNIELPLKMYFERNHSSSSSSLPDNPVKTELDRLNELIANPCVAMADKASACKEYSTLYEQLKDTSLSSSTEGETSTPPPPPPSSVRNYFLMMTDGEPNVGDLKMSRIASRYTCPDTTYYFVGYGKDHSARVMSDLDQQSGNYMAITEDEHAGFVVGDILTRILCPCVERVKLASLDENVELFDAITNTWAPTYQFATLECGKQMTFYFRFKTTEVVCQPQFSISATDTKTKTALTVVTLSEDEPADTFALETSLRIQSLQLLSVIHTRNLEEGQPRQGVFHLSYGFQPAPSLKPIKTFQQLFKDCEAFLVVLKTETAKLVAMDDETIRFSRKLEDLTSAITMVMLTMNSGDKRSAIFSTILLNEWFSHSLRVSTVYATDYTFSRNGETMDLPMPPQCSLGRQFSSDISPRAMETCRSLSANCGAVETELFNPQLDTVKEAQQQQVDDEETEAPTLKRGRL
jgi:hypothetical protein